MRGLLFGTLGVLGLLGCSGAADHGASGARSDKASTSTTRAALVGSPTLEWSVTYAVPGATSTDAVAAALGPDGDMVVLAVNRANAHSADLVKLDASGNVVFDVALTAPDEAMSHLAVSGAGSIVVTGNWLAADGTSGAVVRKWDLNGTPMWTQRWSDGLLGDAAIQDDGDVAVTTAGGTHCVDGADAPRWDSTTAGSLVRFDPVGNVLVVGTSSDGQAAKTTVTSFDTQGNLAWSYRADDGVSRGLVSASYPRAMLIDGNGTTYVAGYRRYKDDPRWPVYQYDTQTIALDTSGALLFKNEDFDSQDGSMGQAIALDPATGRITVTGVTASPNAPGYQQFMTFQYESDGTSRWKLLDTWANEAGHKRPVAVGADSAGAAFVTGTIDQAPNAATVAYAPDGTVAWRVETPGTATAASVDPSGALYVTGADTRGARVTKYTFTP